MTLRIISLRLSFLAFAAACLLLTPLAAALDDTNSRSGSVDLLLQRKQSFASALTQVWKLSGADSSKTAQATADWVYASRLDAARHSVLASAEASSTTSLPTPTIPADASDADDVAHPQEEYPSWDPRSRPQPKLDHSVWRNTPSTRDFPEDDAGPESALFVAADYDAMLTQTFASEAFSSGLAGNALGLHLRAGEIYCPVAGIEPPNFIDSWGFARSGGRTHKGQDLFAPTGTPLVAVREGVVTKTDAVDNYVVGSGRGDLGGITVWLVDSAGDSWYYAHMDSIAPGIVDGTPVRAGQLLGYVGNTGNAATTPPHLHFGWYPQGGTAQNPYSMLAVACAENAPNPLASSDPTADSLSTGEGEEITDLDSAAP